MFKNNRNYSYYQSSSTSSITTPFGNEQKKQNIIAQNNNGKKKGIIQQSINDNSVTKNLNDNEIDNVFNHKIYEDPFQIFNFSKPKLNNLNQNNSSFIPNSLGNTQLDLIDSTGSEMGYNYGQLSSNLNDFIEIQDKTVPYYENFFRFRGGNGK